MKTYFAAEALLPEGWARDVCIEVDGRGAFARVEAAAAPGGAVRLAGPVLPGMANLHSHAFQRAMAGLTEVRAAAQDDFWTWRELMYRFVSRVTPEQIQSIARFLYLELLKSGYTAVAEFHYVHLQLDGAPYARRGEMLLRHLEAARETGIAITLLPSLYRWSNFGRRPLEPRQARFATNPKDILALADAARNAAAGHPDVRVGVAPHSLRAVDADGLVELVEGLRAADAEAPIHIHAAEQTKEVDDCAAATGARPVEWLLEHMPVDDRWCLVHATHLTAAEVSGLAASGAVAGLCPTTEGNLGDGIFPLPAYRVAGGRWGVGGDSHVSRDPAEELRLLEYVQRLTARRRNLAAGGRSRAVGTTLWLEAAEGGGGALGRAMGAIAPGRRADLVVLDPVHPDLAGRSSDAIANALVFSGGTRMVHEVMVGGVWVVREGHHPLDESATQAYKEALTGLFA
jgi:formimidoylglutamate deiminase